ncbi:MAG: sugar ABC transporter permease, partial [Oscillospiraceae bacterium]|nr:sugar ABC transporter permease [Oscillospiraceae bacterium]
MINAAAAKHPRMSKLEKRNTLIAYSFLAPNLIGFVLITMVPVIFSIMLGFLKWNGGALNTITWAGLDNFRELFKR